MIGLAYVELLLRAANVQAASENIFAESGPLHRLVSYPDWKRWSSFAMMAFLKYVRASVRLASHGSDIEARPPAGTNPIMVN